MNFNIFINSLCVFSSRRHSALICSAATPFALLPGPPSPLSYLAVTPMPPGLEPLCFPSTPTTNSDLALLLPSAVATAAWIPSGSVQIFTHFIYMYTRQVFGRFSSVHMQRYIQICFAARAHTARLPSIKAFGVSRKCRLTMQDRTC